MYSSLHGSLLLILHTPSPHVDKGFLTAALMTITKLINLLQGW